jgi:hypothetical protein
MEDWKEHIEQGSTLEHMRDEHDFSPELYAAISEMGRRVMHVGAHESEGTAR